MYQVFGSVSSMCTSFGLSPLYSPCKGRRGPLYEGIIADTRAVAVILGIMGTNEKPKLVGIIDDSESIRTSLEGLMKAVGFPALAFSHAEEFLKSDRKKDIACLILDIRLPGMSGLELQARLNAEHSRIPIVFITAHGDEKMRMQALRAGAVEFLAKPFNDEALLQSVRAALEF
jgi:FixJ family two-component response regulator